MERRWTLDCPFCVCLPLCLLLEMTPLNGRFSSWSYVCLHLAPSPHCPEPTLPWSCRVLCDTNRSHTVLVKIVFNRPQWPAVSGSSICPVFRETSLNPAPLTLLWLLCKVHVSWMKCVIFEPVSVVKNGTEEAVITSGSTMKWNQNYSVNFIRWNWYSLRTFYCPIS